MTDYGGAISLSQPHMSDEDTSEHSPRSIPASPGGGGGFSSKSKTPSSSENTARKPRGRPPGSKNKPKPPTVITRDRDSTMKSVILEISAGSDIFNAIISFARRNRVGINIISVTGSVSNVILRHPVFQATAFSLHGPFTTRASIWRDCRRKVMAATQAIVVAATFVSSAFHRLPCESGNDGGVGGAIGATESCSSTGMSMAVYGVAGPTQPNSQISPGAMPCGPSSRPF
ncbi:hypothetical protein F3Y22_tig00002793pilonHSYRG00103 [Hibiscus syriacus]|uniref:Uncharacterized protein n=1 Tax=Hibiscus syriacus TaxID=106335 RepID=A0A6A3CQZ1_HIBSY|nr:hypothetical protein F3Y22_tig00002793pilonHSYRG00103 [Hibiscus syriacus]